MLRIYERSCTQEPEFIVRILSNLFLGKCNETRRWIYACSPPRFLTRNDKHLDLRSNAKDNYVESQTIILLSPWSMHFVSCIVLSLQRDSMSPLLIMSRFRSIRGERKFIVRSRLRRFIFCNLQWFQRYLLKLRISFLLFMDSAWQMFWLIFDEEFISRFDVEYSFSIVKCIL